MEISVPQAQSIKNGAKPGILEIELEPKAFWRHCRHEREARHPQGIREAERGQLLAEYRASSAIS
jgi:hypothetical protein